VGSARAAVGARRCAAGAPGRHGAEAGGAWQIRKVIAKRLLESKTTVPHYYLSMDVCIDKLMALRATLNKAAKKDKDGNPAYKLSVNDFIIKASALALRAHPDVNCSWMNDVVRKCAPPLLNPPHPAPTPPHPAASRQRTRARHTPRRASLPRVRGPRRGLFRGAS